jgi:uncharacterized protein (TIGR02246 family)
MSGERQSDEDKEAIRELLDRQVTGWDAGDAAAYASVFTPDADYVTFLGSHCRGRDVIAASYVPLLTKLLKGSRLHTEITQLRFLTPDVALIHAKAAVVKTGRRRTRRNARVNTTHRRLAEKLFHKLASRTAPSRGATPQVAGRNSR